MLQFARVKLLEGLIFDSTVLESHRVFLSFLEDPQETVVVFCANFLQLPSWVGQIENKFGFVVNWLGNNIRLLHYLSSLLNFDVLDVPFFQSYSIDQTDSFDDLANEGLIVDVW